MNASNWKSTDTAAAVLAFGLLLGLAIQLAGSLRPLAALVGH